MLGLLALAVTGRADEASAVRTILDLGGAVSVATKRPGMPVVKVDLSGTKITDAGLKVLKELKELRELDLNGTQVTDAGVKELKKALPRLRIHR